MDNKEPASGPLPGATKLNRWILVVVVSIVIVFIGLGSFSVYLKSEVEKKIHQINASASNIEVNLLTGSLKISDLELDSLADSTRVNQHFLRLKALTIRGISYYELILNKRISIREIVLDSGSIRYNKSTSQPRDSVLNAEYKLFRVKSLSLINIEARVRVDTMVNYTALINGQLSGLSIRLDSLNKVTYSVDRVVSYMENIMMSQTGAKYRGAIARLYFDTEDKTITLDSAMLIPTYDKYEFARQAGEQIARLEILIPQIRLEGVKFEKIRDSSFVASKLIIDSFDLHSFKDKRIPFLRTRNIPLPMAGFLSLPYRVQVDSVLINHSHIIIEEFPERGTVPYEVEFNDVNASLSGLNNRLGKETNSYAVMEASGRLLTTGRVHALFKFPLDGSPTYSAHGTISEIPFIELNPILKAVDVRVESGFLNTLTFSFNYTDFTSKGKLEIDYEDLRVTSLDKDKTTTNQLRTVLVNVFVRNNMNQFKSVSKRTGVIEIERDRKRYIFNVWLKSILDGIKSSMTGSNTR